MSNRKRCKKARDGEGQKKREILGERYIQKNREGERDGNEGRALV